MSDCVIFLAHWNFGSSRVNKALINQVKVDLPNVIIRDLYSLYGTNTFESHLDVTEDQKILEKAEKIILQFPFQWYSTPALLKQWLDDALTYGWAYGVKNPALKGKKLYVAVSTGGDDKAYTKEGFNSHAIEDFLFYIMQIAKFCEMEYAGVFKTTNVKQITNDELTQKAKDYITFIKEK